jgi:NADPH:quinone reductase-like Zn-dependent oxidoreductase
MKAVIFERFGGPEVLSYEEVEIPALDHEDVLVRVRACSVNRGVDIAMRENGYGWSALKFPHVTGADIAGEIVEVGAGVRHLEEGDRVVGFPLLVCGECDFCAEGRGQNRCRQYKILGVHAWGGYAQYVKLPARNVLPLSNSITYQDAAALPLSYVSAWHGLVTRAGLTQRDTVLVMAAGSGVGVAATQIAKLMGATVIATAGSDWKLDAARSLGADHAFNYSEAGWGERVREVTGGRGATIVFDNLGQETWPTSIGCLDRCGRFICCGGTLSGPVLKVDVRTLYRNQIACHFFTAGTSNDLAGLLELVRTGKLKPVIDSTYSLQEATAAQEKVLDRAVFGKVLLLPEHSH